MTHTLRATNPFSAKRRLALLGVALAALLGCTAAAVLAAGVGGFPHARLVETAAGGFVVLVLGAAALPALVGRWRPVLALLFAWFVVEDLLRKLAGNDLRFYFAKDAIFLALLFALATDPSVRGAWRRATGRARFALYAMVAWAMALSVTALASDPRLPLVGLRLSFLYAPLVVAGFLLASQTARLRAWLTGLATIAAIAGGIGIAQAVIGPDFLSPGRPTNLPYLNLVRRSASGAVVFQPSGPFVDPGRFINVNVIGVLLVLGVLVLPGRAPRRVLLAGLVSAAAALIAGGKAALVMAGWLVLAAVASGRFGGRLRRPGRGARVVALAVGAIVALALLYPDLFSNRVEYFTSTLSPTSRESEWGLRAAGWRDDVVRGAEIGGLLGTGTGRESLGRQYLFADEADVRRLSEVEGGYASVLVEWGLAGLVLWLAWTIIWARRLWLAVLACRGSPWGATCFVLFAWLFLFVFVKFLTGLQSWQDYIPNAYFWLLSGVVFGLGVRARERGDGRVGAVGVRVADPVG